MEKFKPIYEGAVIQHPEHGPIYITSGYYLDPVYQRLSNFFSWRKIERDGSLSKKQYNGYSGNWPHIKGCKVLVTVVLPK